MYIVFLCEHMYTMWAPFSKFKGLLLSRETSVSLIKNSSQSEGKHL